MATLSQLYSMKEIEQHNTSTDCWVLIEGKVYDLTSYLDEHPGGDDVVLAATGKDATDDFEDAGHSKSARELMQKFCVGELDTCSQEGIPDIEISSEKEIREYPKELVALSKQHWGLPVAILGISVIVGVFFLRKK